MQRRKMKSVRRTDGLFPESRRLSRRPSLPPSLPLPSARGKFMANCFNRRGVVPPGARNIPRGIYRPRESGHSGVVAAADFAKEEKEMRAVGWEGGGILPSGRAKASGTRTEGCKKERERERKPRGVIRCFIMRLTFEIFCLLTRKITARARWSKLYRARESLPAN